MMHTDSCTCLLSLFLLPSLLEFLLECILHAEISSRITTLKMHLWQVP